MDDLKQQVFDTAEDIALALHQIEGCEKALRAVLEQHRPPEGQSAIYAVIEAIGLFRSRAASHADILSRQMAGTPAH